MAPSVTTVAFDLAVWDADRPPTLLQARDRHDRLSQGQDQAAAPSPRIDAFADECRRRWPGGPGGGDAPFSLRRTATGLLAEIKADEATALFGDWAEMAERHGVVLYDPQSGVVLIPSRLSFDAQPPPTLGRRPKLGGRRQRPSPP